MKPLKEDKVIEICKLIARKDITLREISKLMRVSSVTIRHILNRKKYTEYSKEYSFMHRITALHLTPGLGERVVRLLETERYSLSDIANYVGADIKIIARIESERRKTYVPVPQEYVIDERSFDQSQTKDIQETTLNRRRAHVITTDSPDDADWKRIIVNDMKSVYESDVNGYVRNSIRGRLLTPKKSESNELYFLEIEHHKVSIQRKRLVASLWVPIPDKYKNVDVTSMEIYHKNADNHDFSLDNIKWYYRGDPSLNREDLPYYLRYTMSDKNKAVNLLKNKDFKITEIADVTNIGRASLSMLSCGKIWCPGIEDEQIPPRTTRSCDSEVVHKICRDLQNGMKVCEVSRKYNVDYYIVSCIHQRKTYAEITSQYYWDPPSRTIPEHKVRKACEYIEDGKWTLKQIKLFTNLSTSTISRIKARKIYTDISKDYVW